MSVVLNHPPTCDCVYCRVGRSEAEQRLIDTARAEGYAAATVEIEKLRGMLTRAQQAVGYVALSGSEVSRPKCEALFVEIEAYFDSIEDHTTTAGEE